ncbi:hypothetical protein [Kribbella speibonae]|uniref:Uncharacterized protein n=1 Tax=Kribbella speibonae TaxID=1572660 RepID=A0ABY2AF74_9ACTN|nr:hypothetical protein [Kribbella speibonae]TCC27482.1 hypothetical protein E0H58_05835 [Kribbella speibonae]
MDSLPCGHIAHRGPSRFCPHLVSGEDRWVEAIAHLTGNDLDFDLSCKDCDAAAQPIAWVDVCEGCVQRVMEDDNPVAWRGRPGVKHRPEPVETSLTSTALPTNLARPADFTALPGTAGNWLILTADGLLSTFDADTGEHVLLARADLPAEPTPDLGKTPRPRIHADPSGRYVAIVNDYGRYGVVLDLHDGRETMRLDRGDYHPEQTPFPIAFLTVDDDIALVHATAWNRLDASDPATGQLRTHRDQTPYLAGQPRPEHYLDYFHGALHLSPDGRWLADDGWVWSPVGLPRVWDAQHWLRTNVWESEDGGSARRLAHRAYYWDKPMCWVSNDLVAISGIGYDDEATLDGVRIFDVTTGDEVLAFACPIRALFGAPGRLYASSETELQIWDPRTAELIGTVDHFAPTRHHQGSGELAQIENGQLTRWSTR